MQNQPNVHQHVNRKRQMNIHAYKHICINICVCMGFYPTIKRNEILSFTRKWIKLETMSLSKTSQIQKDKYHMISFICISKLNIYSYAYIGHKIEGGLYGAWGVV